MFQFNSIEIRTQITCIKVLNYHILVAVGDHIYTYLKQDHSQLISKLQVFKNQQIYGIEMSRSKNKLLVYGGSYLKVFNMMASENEFTISEASQLVESDWILVAKWVQDDDIVAIVTMHNKAIFYTNVMEWLLEVSCIEKCILYSAYIYCDEGFENLVVLSGTVFGEVILWQPFKKCTLNDEEDKNSSPVLKRLKGHKGVIFSIDYQPKVGLICSTSDDRSAILWKVHNKCLIKELAVDDLREIKVTKKCYVNGHSSRIFRSIILDTIFVTAGEDSLLCIWNFCGELLRKIETRQSSPVWAVDGNESENLILTGSGDGGVCKFTIRRLVSELTIPLEPALIPKHVCFLKSGNIAYITTSGSLYYLIPSNQYSVHIVSHPDLQNYVVFEVSICRMMLALGSFNGLVFIYKETGNVLNLYTLVELRNSTRIFSMHWISCNQFLTCQDEKALTLVDFNSENFNLKNYQLPYSKSIDKWTTCALLVNKNYFIVGDRRGDVTLFKIDTAEPVTTIKRAHSCLGVSYFFRNCGSLKSLGRDGYVRGYSIKSSLTIESKDKMPYTWLAKVDNNLLLAFSGDNFVIADFQSRQTLVERNCAGGHRSWDFFRRDMLSFVYLKDKKIHVMYSDYKSIIPRDIIEGFHVNDINAMKVIKCENDYIIVSGGEDTFLRISTLENGRLKVYITLKAQLSSIRTITIQNLKKNESKSKYLHSFLVFTGGGRAQIITWLLRIKQTNGKITISCEEQHNLYEETKESETRIMDLRVVEYRNNIQLFAALSDGNCKQFMVNQDKEGRFFILYKAIFFYQIKCILKTANIAICDSLLLVIFSTDGKIVFWDNDNHQPKCSFALHQSGINSYSYKVINDKLLLLTGGDDNSVILSLFQIQNSKVIFLDVNVNNNVHCAQITGAHICDNYFITGAIDQRVAIFKWKIVEGKLSSKFIQKYVSCIPDMQGLRCFEDGDTFDVFVYGSGFQYIRITKES